MSASVMSVQRSSDRCDAAPSTIPKGGMTTRIKALTCNRWRRTGNIANRTTAYNIRANTEMSSGNRDASTTDADMAALMENTDVRLGDQRSKGCLGPWEQHNDRNHTFLGRRSLGAENCSPQSRH